MRVRASLLRTTERAERLTFVPRRNQSPPHGLQGAVSIIASNQHRPGSSRCVDEERTSWDYLLSPFPFRHQIRDGRALVRCQIEVGGMRPAAIRPLRFLARLRLPITIRARTRQFTGRQSTGPKMNMDKPKQCDILPPNIEDRQGTTRIPNEERYHHGLEALKAPVPSQSHTWVQWNTTGTNQAARPHMADPDNAAQVFTVLRAFAACRK